MFLERLCSRTVMIFVSGLTFCNEDLVEVFVCNRSIIYMFVYPCVYTRIE